MNDFGYVWYVTWFCVGASYVLLAVNIVKMNNVSNLLQGELTSHEDLFLLRGAINQSMQLAIVYLGMFVLFVLCLLVLVFVLGMDFFQGSMCLFVFGVTTLPVGLYGKHVEKRLKTLYVSSDDPEIQETYQRWLQQWGEPRFKLPD